MPNALRPHFLRAAVFSLGSQLAAVSSTQAAQPDKANRASVPPAEREVIPLSAEKWKWMADKDAAQLAALFDDKAKFVHLSGTWKTAEELEIIRTGSIW